MRKTGVLLIALLLLISNGLTFAGQAERERPVELSFFRWAIPDEGQAIYRKHIEQFERDHGVKVDISFVPWGEYVDSLIRFQMADSLPDVFAVYDGNLGTFQDFGSLLALDDYLSDEFRANFFDTHWNHMVVGGQTYGVTFRNGVKLLFYNKDLFRAAGLSEKMIEYGPGNYTEFIEAAIATTGNGIYGFADGYGDEEGMHQFRDFVQAAGEWPVDPETYEGRLTTRQAIDALQLLVDLNNKYRVVPPGALGKPSTLKNQEFVNGMAAMTQGGPWIEGDWRAAGRQFELGLTEMPHPDYLDGSQGSSSAYVGHAVAANTPHKELAVELVKYLSSYDFINEYCKSRGLLPTRSDVAQTDPHWQTGNLPFYIEITDRPNFGPAVTHPQTAEYHRIIRTAIEYALMEEKSVEDALADANDRWNAIR